LRIRAPRELAALPYAHRLVAFDEEFARDGDHESEHFADRVIDDVEGGGSVFTECAFSGVTFSGGRLRRARFDDVWMHGVRVVGTDFVESAWMDVECVAGMWAGMEIFGAGMRRVTFHNCKFDSDNLRSATLREVAFSECLLRDVDFGGASLTDVVFSGTTLERVRFENAKLSKVDLRGAAALGISAGLESMRGATIDTGQLMELAPGLAHVVGLTVKDR